MMQKGGKKPNITPLYSLSLCFYWMGFAAITAYASVYLLGYGASNTAIGTVMAVSGILTSVLSPILGTLSDKYERFSARRILYVFFLLVLIIAASMFLLKGTNLLLTCTFYCLCMAGMMLTQPFVNAIGMLYLNRGYELDFGFARATGSIGYAFAAYILGIASEKFGISVVPVSIFVTFGLSALVVVFFPKIPSGTAQSMEHGDGGDVSSAGVEHGDGGDVSSTGFFRKYPRFTILLMGLICLYFGHVLINNFTLQIVQTKGGGSAQMGYATSLSAMLELVMMFGFTRLIKKVSLKTILRISFVAFTLKILGSLLATNMTTYYMVQIFQMFGWAVMAVGLVLYVNDIMEPEDLTKGQAYASMMYALANVVGAWIGGALLDVAGVPAMLICGVIVSAVGTVVCWIGTAK